VQAAAAMPGAAVINHPGESIMNVKTNVKVGTIPFPIRLR
jgi:hypothetical protein